MIKKRRKQLGKSPLDESLLNSKIQSNINQSAHMSYMSTVTDQRGKP